MKEKEKKKERERGIGASAPSLGNNRRLAREATIRHLVHDSGADHTRTDSILLDLLSSLNSDLLPAGKQPTNLPFLPSPQL